MTDQRDDMDRRDEAREARLPEHELDRDESIGGGLMSSGGTAVDRGTGTLSDVDYDEMGDRRVDEEPLDAMVDLGPEHASRDDQPVTERDRPNEGPLSGDPDENEPDDTVPSPYFRA